MREDFFGFGILSMSVSRTFCFIKDGCYGNVGVLHHVDWLSVNVLGSIFLRFLGLRFSNNKVVVSKVSIMGLSTSSGLYGSMFDVLGLERPNIRQS